MQTFDTPTPISAVLDIPAGRIQFIAADRADTAVEILPADSSKRRDVKVAEQTKVEYGDGVLRIVASAKNQYFGPSGSIEVTVQLPAGSRVEAKAASAEFRGVGRLGDVAFDGALRRHGSSSTKPRAPASPPSPATYRSAAWAAPRRSAPQRATSASPKPCAARSCCAPRWATSRSAPPTECPPPWTPAPATAASATPQERRRRRPEHPRDHRLRRHHRPQPVKEHPS